MLESILEQHFQRKVRALGGLAVKLAPIDAGTPDRLVIMPGPRFYLVELKADNGALSPIQRVWHSKCPAPVVVLKGKREIDNWLETLMILG